MAMVLFTVRVVNTTIFDTVAAQKYMATVTIRIGADCEDIGNISTVQGNYQLSD